MENWLQHYEKGGDVLKKVLSYTPVVAGVKKLMSNFAENVNTYEYDKPLERIVNNGLLNKKDENRKLSEEFPVDIDRERIDLLKILANQKQKYNSIPLAEYKPQIEENKNTQYYKSPSTEEQLQEYIDQNWIKKPILSKEDLPERKRSQALGNVKFDYGTDKQGNYISYYDKWDLNPIPQTGINWIDKTVDKVVTGIPNALGITNTPEVYGRVYLPEKKDGGELQKLNTNYNKSNWLSQHYK